MFFQPAKPCYGSAAERVVDTRLLVGAEHLVECFERWFCLLQGFQPRRQQLLATVNPIKDGFVAAVLPGWERRTELAFSVGRRLDDTVQFVPKRPLLSGQVQLGDGVGD